MGRRAIRDPVSFDTRVAISNVPSGAQHRFGRDGDQQAGGDRARPLVTDIAPRKGALLIAG